jgi:protein-S-isoprenylcysteine O-methyltransferase Ste14
VHFEERSLLRELGESYARYRSEVPMLLPLPR